MNALSIEVVQTNGLAQTDEVYQLSSAQTTVLERLAAGESIKSAAELAGTARSNVYRWLEDDAVFKAAYNAWQKSVQTSARARLLALSDAAIRTVTAAVEKGDARIAMAVLDKQGLLKPAEPGSTDASIVATEKTIELRRIDKKLDNDIFEANLPG